MSLYQLEELAGEGYHAIKVSNSCFKVQKESLANIEELAKDLMLRFHVCVSLIILEL